MLGGDGLPGPFLGKHKILKKGRERKGKLDFDKRSYEGKWKLDGHLKFKGHLLAFAQSCIIQNNTHQQRITKYFHTKHIAAQILILKPKGLAMHYKLDTLSTYLLKYAFILFMPGSQRGPKHEKLREGTPVKQTNQSTKLKSNGLSIFFFKDTLKPNPRASLSFTGRTAGGPAEQLWARGHH